LTCEFCKKEFEKPFISRRHGRFCSKSCAKSGENNPSCRLEVRKKISESSLLKYKLGYVHPWLGRKHTEETRKQIQKIRLANPLSGERNGMWGKKHSEDAKERMSDAKTKLIISGKFKPYTVGSKKGHYTSTRTQKTYFFRSSWEYAFMVWLDNNPDVVFWDYECVRIPYYYNDNKRWYVPDFVVMYSDNLKPVMYEIKPLELTDSVRIMLKREAANLWCAQNGYKENITLTRKCLIEMGVDLKIEIKSHELNSPTTPELDILNDQ
jgi:hypothetical protein